MKILTILIDSTNAISTTLINGRFRNCFQSPKKHRAVSNVVLQIKTIEDSSLSQLFRYMEKELLYLLYILNTDHGKET